MPERQDLDIRKRSFWSGSVSFGLVSIPVALFSGRRSGRGRLRLLGPDGTPLSRRYYCPTEDRPIGRDEIIRGFEVEKGKFVTVTEEELESLQPEKSRAIDLRRFVPRDQIDPKFFDRPYFLVPVGDSLKPYRLLAEIMEMTGRAGIATFVMRSREYPVAILAENGILRAETLRFADEIRQPETAAPLEEAGADAREVKAMTQAIRAAAGAFNPEELKDEAADRLEALAEEKRAAGRDVVTVSEADAETEDEENVIDMMEILKRSIARETGESIGA